MEKRYWWVYYKIVDGTTDVIKEYTRAIDEHPFEYCHGPITIISWQPITKEDYDLWEKIIQENMKKELARLRKGNLDA